MNKKAVLFDMDGTLINTYENIDFRLVLNELKTVQKTLILNVLKSRVHSFADMERKIYETCDDEAEAQDLIQRIQDFLSKHYDQASLKKDALTFLQYLKQSQYKVCLCTNNATDVVEHILQSKGIREYFDCVITSQQVTHSKPNPQMYLVAMNEIQLQPQDCIVFEDTEHGVMAARCANMDVIAVCEKDKRKFNECMMTIRDFSDKRLYTYF